MTEAHMRKWISLLTTKKLVVCLSLLLALLIAGCAVEEKVSTERLEAGEQFRQMMADESVTDITVTGTIYLTEPVEVKGKKTISGDGVVKAVADWSCDGATQNYLLVLEPDTIVTMTGSVKLNANRKCGGVYIDERASMLMESETTVTKSSAAYANVMDLGSFSMKGGNLTGAKGHNLYVASTASIEGGTIKGSGKNCAGIYVAGTLEQDGGTVTGAYDNVWVADGAEFKLMSGENLNSKHDGVSVQVGGVLNVFSADAKIEYAGEQGIFVAGNAVINNVSVKNCGQNNVKINADATVTINDGTFNGSEGHGISNSGTLVMNGGYVYNSTFCGVVTSGKLELNKGNIMNNTQKGILVRNGGDLTVASENVMITGNKIGIAVEENAHADVSRATVMTNTLYNFSCFGELYLHDITTGSSGSNCVFTNYGGHVVMEDMTITSTSSNNGVYNTNGSFVELDNVTFKGIKTFAIRNLDADVSGNNITVINCGGAISMGSGSYGPTGTMEISNMVTEGITTFNVNADAGCNGVIKLSDSVLGATGSNNMSLKGGNIQLYNVEVLGNDPAATTTIHGILMDEGAVVSANKLTIRNTKYSAIRNRGGVFVGSNVTLTNLGEHGISSSNGPSTGNAGTTTIHGLVISGAAKNNIYNDGKGEVKLYNATLEKTGSNNIGSYGAGKIYLESSTVKGTTKDINDNVHGFMIVKGTVEAVNVTITDCKSAAIRNRGGTFIGTNITVDGAQSGVISSDGTVTITGLTTKNITNNNIYTDGDSAVVELIDSNLGGTANSNNIRIFKGTVNMKNVDVTGHSVETYTDAIHAIMITGGKLTAEDVKLHDALNSAIRIGGGVLEGTKVNIENVDTAITSNGGDVSISNLTTSGVKTENVHIDGEKSTVKLTDATLCGVNNNNIRVFGGTVTLKNVDVTGHSAQTTKDGVHAVMLTGGKVVAEDVKIHDVVTSAVRNKGGAFEGKNIAVDGAQSAINSSDGIVTVTGLTTRNVKSNNIYTDGDSVKVSVTDATLCGTANSNNIRIFKGTVNMKNVDVIGHSVETYTDAIHAIMITGGKLTAEDVKLHDALNSAIRIGGGVLEGTKVIVENVDTAITSNGGDVSISNLTTSGVKTETIHIEGEKSTVKLTDSTLGGVNGNNIRVFGGTVTLKNVDVTGHSVETYTDAIHAIMITGGKLTAEDVKIHDVISAAVRSKDGEFNGTNIVVDGAQSGIISSGGTVNISGLTTKNIKTNNIYTDGDNAEVTVTNAALCGTTSNNIRIFKGTVTLLDSNMTAHSIDTTKDTIHGIMLSGGKLIVKNSNIHDSLNTAIRNKGGEVEVEVLQVKDVGATALSNSGGIMTISGLTTENVGQRNVESDAGTLTVTDSVLGVATNSHGIGIYGGTATLKNIEIKGTGGSNHGLYVAKGTVEADNLKIHDVYAAIRINGTEAKVRITNSIGTDCRANGAWISNGEVTLDGVEFSDVVSNTFLMENGTVTVGKLYIHDVGTKNDQHAVFISNGTLTITDELEVEKTTGAAIRIKGGNMTVANVTAKKIGTNVIQQNGGQLTVNSMTTQETVTCNINLNGGTLNVTGAMLGTSGSHSIAIYNGEATVKDVTVNGTSGKSSGLYVEKGTVQIDNVDIHDVYTAFQLKQVANAEPAVTLGNIEINNVTSNSFLVQNGVVNVKKLSIRNAGTQNNEHAVFVSGGVLTVEEDLDIQNTTGAAIRISGGTMTAANVTAKKIGTNVIQSTGGQLTVNGLTTEQVGACNITQNSGETTVSDAQLCKVTGDDKNNIQLNGGKLTLDDVDIMGSKATGIYVASGAELEGNEVLVTGCANAMINAGSVKLTEASVRENDNGITNQGSLTMTEMVVRDNGTYGIVNTGAATLESGYVHGHTTYDVDNNGALSIGNVAIGMDPGGNADGNGLNMQKGGVTYIGTKTQHTASAPMHLNCGTLDQGTTLISFQDADTAQALKDCFKINSSFMAKIKGENLVLDGYCASVSVDGEMYKFESLEEAVSFAAEKSTAKEAVTVTVHADIVISSVIKLQGENANVIITDNGKAHTISRSANLTDDAGYARMFFVSGGAKLTFAPTGDDKAPTLTVDGKNIDTTTNASVVEVTGAGSQVTINAGIVFQNNKTNSTGAVLNIKNQTSVTINGGLFTGNTAADNGGAICAAVNANIVVSNATFTKNHSEKRGGAILATKVTINNCVFEENTCKDSGGAIQLLDNTGIGTIKNCVFNKNVATGNGGAVHVRHSSNYTIENCTFTENAAVHGGAICGANDGTLTIKGGSFEKNKATTGNGGALNVAAEMTVTVTGVKFDGNAAGNNGGAIQNDNKKGLLLENCTISNNSAKLGGGVYMSTDTKITVNNCDFAGNAATGEGGAIYAVTETTVKVTESTFSKNTSNGTGGAIFAKGTANVTIAKCEFSENTSKGNGGAIQMTENVTGTIENSSFSGNVAGSNGGAVHARGKKVYTITNCTFTANTANYGGAVIVADSASATIQGGAFRNNTAKNGGGAIDAGSTGGVEVSEVTFEGNSSQNGGAVRVENKGAEVTFVDCTFTKNTATGNGGAIISEEVKSNKLLIKNCTITGNSAVNGGGLYLPGTAYVTLDGCNITGNTSTGKQGDNVQTAGTAQNIIIKSTEQATKLDIYCRNKSTIVVNGELKSGSQITCDWFVDATDGRIPAIAVICDSESVANVNKSYFAVGATCKKNGYDLKWSGAEATLSK